MTVRHPVAGISRAAAGAVGAMACLAALATCGHSPEQAPTQQRAPGGRDGSADPTGAGPRDARAAGSAAEASQQERLAAIQKAMNELDEAAQQCWAAAATERFDIEGEVALQIDIAPGRAAATVVHDTARNAKLAACLVEIMAGYRWAPPLYGQAIQLPFQFRAPDGQNTIDRALVAWHGQGSGKGKLSVAVLIDENNTGSDAASLVEVAIAAGGSTGLRRADRAELWYFLGAGQVRSPAGGSRAVAAGDMMYAPRGSVREVAADAADLHAMIAIVPGGREGAARSGALPTPEVTGAVGRAAAPTILPAAGAKPHVPDRTLSAAILTLPAGARLIEHTHAGEAELLYLLGGAGTLTVNGVALPVTATSVVQIPKNTRHALVATSDIRAVQIFTPAGPEQRAQVHP